MPLPMGSFEAKKVARRWSTTAQEQHQQQVVVRAVRPGGQSQAGARRANSGAGGTENRH